MIGYIALEQTGQVSCIELATFAMCILTYVGSRYEPGKEMDDWLNSIPDKVRHGMALANQAEKITHQSPPSIN